MRRGSFQLMKKMNRNIILDLIRKRGPISRAQIAEFSELSPATVTNIVKELLEVNLVQETTRGKSRGGRKPILLQIKPSGAFAVGLEWGISSIKGTVLNLNSEEVDFYEVMVNDFRPEVFFEITCDIINHFEEKLREEKICGVGIGVHGLVDPEKGFSRFAPHFQWKDIPVKTILEDKIDYPVLIDNDVRMMALTEKNKDRNDFIYINTGPGIGAAIVIDKRLHYGRDWSAGEFGHMTIVEDGPVCSCGNHGCLEALISLNSLVKKYNEEISLEADFEEINREWQQLIKDASVGSGSAKFILKEAARFLGTGIANLVNLLNPELIVIGGPFIEASEIMLPVIKEETASQALKIPGKNLNIVMGNYRKKAGAVGAAIKVIQEQFKVSN